ncbi:hypothetical protein [Actinomyces sp.]|uniref:hypothetical protein n=1 Tax=Actinomyces sp. TaxID=29317 RepID=UPI002907C0C9|nr:hypothetical protein [Actinomyces sp.]MDU6757687.1 hypothetical protein [Actinomyces sp.]
MNPSLREEYQTIRALITDGKNTAVQLKETLSRVREADSALSKEGKRYLLWAIGWAGGAAKCFDIILEKVDQATTQPQTLKELTPWRK